ncbi:AAD14_5 [Sanghuangporus weigelae]
MQKAPYVFPIIGGRKVEHLMANIDALKILLSEEEIQRLECIVPFDDPGFPYSLVSTTSGLKMVLINSGHEDMWPDKEPVRPAKE